MGFKYINRPRGGSSRAFDSDVLAWRDQVVLNGGSVSLARLIIVDQFVYSERASGAYALTDDYLALWGESSVQALTSLKQRRLAMVVNSPTFTANRDYTFDGATNYIDTGFNPSLHAPVATSDNVRLDVYERANVSVVGYAAGTTSATGSRSIRLNPRSGTSISAAANTNQAGATFDLPSADSRGLTSVSRNAANAAANLGYKNGVLLNRSADPTTFGTTLPSHTLYLGAVNQTGVASFFRACSIGFVSIGASLSAGQEAARYAAVQAWATSIGAQV